MPTQSVRFRAAVTLGAAAAILAACGGTGVRDVEACGKASKSAQGIAAADPPQQLLAVVVPPNKPAVLARLDAVSLTPVSRQVVVGEYHDAWSVSPNGAMVALALSASGPRVGAGRIGIRIVDLRSMKVIREIETGIAAAAVAWLAPRRLVASLLAGGTVLIDPLTGTTLYRWRRFSSPQAAARHGAVFVMLFGNRTNGGAARLVVVDGRGRLRSVVLDDVLLSGRLEEAIGLAIEPAAGRAYVAAADAPIAAVDLRTLRVSYHLRLEPAELAEGDVVRARQRRAVWVGEDRIAVFGRELVGRSGRLAAVPAGVTLIDTDKWSGCMLNGDASGAAVVAGRVLAYGPRLPVARDEPGVGLHAYTSDGEEIFHLFGDGKVWDVDTAGHRAYIRTGASLHVVDVTSAKVVHSIASASEVADVIGTEP